MGSKTMSYRQNIEKPCLQSNDHIFDSIIIILGQNACLSNSSNDFEQRSSRFKTRSRGLKIEQY
jgi:hypothetical protein